MVSFCLTSLGIDNDENRQALGLEKLSASTIASAFQVNESNPMEGVEGRASLLINLGKALAASPEYFGSDARPGNMIGESRTQVAAGPLLRMIRLSCQGWGSEWGSDSSPSIRAVAYSYGRLGANMAVLPNQLWWCRPWRCLAVFRAWLRRGRN